MAYHLGIDVGGTKILALVADEEGRVHRRIRVPTAASGGLTVLPPGIEALVGGSDPQISGIGLAVAGFVAQPSGRIEFAPNLPVGDPEFGAHLAVQAGLPVVVDNDANAAAWAENRIGAGQGTTEMLMLTVGTGIGGGIVAGGRLYRGSRGFAAEFGHTPLDPQGPPCACGNTGCLEALASGTALARRAREMVGADPGSTILARAGGDPEAIEGRTIGEAAAAGDAAALRLLDEAGVCLGMALDGLGKIFDPELIVLGGGVLESGPRIVESARGELRRRYPAHLEPPEVVSASLGNEAGAVGAALLSLAASRV